MKEKKPVVYPYIPNSAPEARAQMLQATGAQGTDDFFEDVPESLRLRRKLNLPEPLLSEAALERHVREILGKNQTADSNLNFLGAGCYQHHVPAVCDEVNQRSEFLTAYAGEPYDDHGRFQTLFEYCSMMGDLLNMDVVNVPTYDGFQASATAIRMAARLTGRSEALICRTINPDKLSKIRDYCAPDITIKLVDTDPQSGQLNLELLARQISADTAVVYFDNPSYLGFIETQGQAISDLAHENGALSVVGVDPISLGILAPPADYGADIACGDIQPLGIPMNYGGGLAGFIASHDDERVVMEYPSRLFGIAPTTVPGEYGFGDVAYERTSFAIREEGKEWVGTAAALWGITAGVYLALMGPKGMTEIGESIISRARYAALQLNKIKGVQAPLFTATHFKEFVVNFDQTGKSVSDINDALLAQGIFGGRDLSSQFPDLGQSALYCVTEIHTQADIDRLAQTIQEVIER